MPKKKLQRFAELDTFPNTLQFPADIKGKWRQDVFKNSNPIVLEVGCGRAEYTIGLGRRQAERNYIGIDIKGNRMWRGAKTAMEEQLNHVAFLRIQLENIVAYFAPDEIDEIWITFPDPQPNKPKIRKRLSGTRFINLYRQICKAGSLVHLKTDNLMLHEFTQDVITEMGLSLILKSDNVYADDLPPEVKEIQTSYEKKFLQEGKKIHYLRFRI